MWLAGAYLRLVVRTTIRQIDGADHLAPHVAGTPCIAAFWHETLPLMSALRVSVRGQSRKRVHVLVSRHRDGRFVGAVVRRLQMELVHGSPARRTKSSRGGAVATRTMVEVLAGGDFLAITPDGPRGPRRIVAPGVAQIAALSVCPVLPCAGQTSRHRILPSGDRMRVPLPFGRGVLICAPVIAVPPGQWKAALPAIAVARTTALSRADDLCRRPP